MYKCKMINLLKGKHSEDKTIIQYEVVLVSSRTVIVVTASVKEVESTVQGHTSESLLQQSATLYRALDTHCIYTSAFST
jgi:hypothetical protein